MCLIKSLSLQYYFQYVFCLSFLSLRLHKNFQDQIPPNFLQNIFSEISTSLSLFYWRILICSKQFKSVKPLEKNFKL